MNERVQKIMHFLAGALVILHALDHYESGYGAILFYFVLGLIMLTLALFQDSIEKRSQKLAGVLYWIEGIVIFFIAFEKFEAFKRIIPVIYLFIGIFYFFTGYFMITKKVKVKKRRS